MTSAETTALLTALSAELAAMRATVAALDFLMLDHVRLVAPADRAGVLVRAQAVDALGQQLQALRDLSLTLAEGAPIPAALDRIPLADLADRLRKTVLNHEVAAPSAPALPGDLALFD